MDKYEKIANEQRQNRRKSNVILIIGIVAVVLAMVLTPLFLLMDVNYDREFEALVVRKADGGYEMLGTVDVAVSGEYDFELFGTTTNKGTAIVDGVKYEYSGKYDKPINPFSKQCSVNNSTLDEKGNVVRGDFSARINGRNAGEMVIMIDDFTFDGAGEAEWIYIVCNADDLKEAEKILDKLLN